MSADVYISFFLVLYAIRILCVYQAYVIIWLYVMVVVYFQKLAMFFWLKLS